MFNRLTHPAITVAILLMARAAASAATLETIRQPPGVNVVVTSPAGSYFTLESSTNFAIWTSEAMKLGGSPQPFYQVPPPGNSFRFYRAQ